MEKDIILQMSGCHSRSVQPATSVFSLRSQAEQFVDLVLAYQTDHSHVTRKALENELEASFSRESVRPLLCLLEAAEGQTIWRFACTHLLSADAIEQTSVSVVIRPNPDKIGTWGNKGRFFILIQKAEGQEETLHFTNQASAVYYLMFLIHRSQETSVVAAPVSLARNRETFIKLYHQMYNIDDRKLRQRVERLLRRQVDGIVRVGRQNELRRDIRRHLEAVFTTLGESARPYAITAKEHLGIPPHLIRFEDEAQYLLNYKFI